MRWNPVRCWKLPFEVWRLRGLNSPRERGKRTRYNYFSLRGTSEGGGLISCFLKSDCALQLIGGCLGFAAPMDTSNFRSPLIWFQGTRESLVCSSAEPRSSVFPSVRTQLGNVITAFAAELRNGTSTMPSISPCIEAGMKFARPSVEVTIELRGLSSFLLLLTGREHRRENRWKVASQFLSCVITGRRYRLIEAMHKNPMTGSLRFVSIIVTWNSSQVRYSELSSELDESWIAIVDAISYNSFERTWV